MKPALMVIDIQKRFFGESEVARQSLEEAVEYTNVAIALFREKGLPVVCVQHKSASLVPSAPDFDGPESLKILSSDRHFVKTHGNAFMEPELLPYLKELGVDTVIITGFCAEYCVLSTYRGAQDNGLTPIIMRGSLASVNLDNIRFVESISDVISYGALKKVLENC